MMNFENLIVFGDLHGYFVDIITFTKKYGIKNTAFLGAGDFGAGFERSDNENFRMLDYINPNLKNNNNFVFVTRGNHDNPEYYRNNYTVGNIQLIPDYTELSVNGLNILMVGGAVSVDRKPNPLFKNSTGRSTHKGRKVGIDYWEDEVFEFNQDKINALQTKIDVVITHSAPHFCHPQDYNNIEKWTLYDDTLRADVMKERQDITKLYEALKKNNHPIDKWFYGHFHHTWKEKIDNTTFELVDKNGFVDLKF